MTCCVLIGTLNRTHSLTDMTTFVIIVLILVVFCYIIVINEFLWTVYVYWKSHSVLICGISFLFLSPNSLPIMSQSGADDSEVSEWVRKWKNNTLRRPLKEAPRDCSALVSVCFQCSDYNATMLSTYL